MDSVDKFRRQLTEDSLPRSTPQLFMKPARLRTVYAPGPSLHPGERHPIGRAGGSMMVSETERLLSGLRQAKAKVDASSKDNSSTPTRKKSQLQ